MTNRLDRLERLLNAGHELTLQDIQERLGLLSERQVRRLINQLRDNGTLVQERHEGRHKVFFLPAEHQKLPVIGLEFEEQELFALMVAAHAAQAAVDPTPLGEPMRRAFNKLLDQMEGTVLTFEPHASYWHFQSSSASVIRPEVFKALTQAIEDSRCVRIDYHTASTGAFSPGRLVDPYLLAVCGSSWLLVAYCHTRRDILDFSLAGITRVENEDRYFMRPDSFDPELHFRDRFSAMKGDAVYEIRLHVDRTKALYFERKLYHPTQQIETNSEDGLVVSYEVSGLDEIAAFIRSWGPGVRVLDPPELVDRLTEQAQAVLESYRVKAD